MLTLEMLFISQASIQIYHEKQTGKTEQLLNCSKKITLT